MSEINWTSEGEKVFEKIIDTIPEAMREMLKPKLLELLAAKSKGEPVTPEIIIQMVQEDLPEPQKSVLMDMLTETSNEKKQPSSQDGMPSLEWSGKSANMFDTILGQVPDAMREVFRGKLLEIIIQKSQSGPASEEIVTAVVNEIVPEPFKTNILEKFKELGDFDINVIDNIIARHGTDQEKLMYVLHDIQDKIGYLPVEALRAVSNKNNIPLSTIYNIVTFYKSFKLCPPKKHHVKICMGTACYLKDTDNISEKIDQKISASSDATLEKTLCLGCCDCAPVVEIDGTTYNSKDADLKIDSL
jgi:NADH:ubiquinone oxidoreductase subunit E